MNKYAMGQHANLAVLDFDQKQTPGTTIIGRAARLTRTADAGLRAGASTANQTTRAERHRVSHCVRTAVVLLPIRHMTDCG